MVFVGVNSIGKTLLVNQVLSSRFRKEFLTGKKVKLIFLEFKDKFPPTSQQLYRYWLEKSAEVFRYKLNKGEEYNDFSFYYHLGEMAKRLKPDEKAVFIVLDFQHLLLQGETFFRSLIYLQRWTYGRITFVILSEPHILECDNIWLHRFIQDLAKNRYIFLKLFDKKTILADIEREQSYLQANLGLRRSLVTRYSGGLHGVIGALCYFLHNNPKVKDGRALKKIVFGDEMFRYWINDIFSSLPPQSVRILQEVVLKEKQFSNYKHAIYGKWLIDLGFLKRNGRFRHPLMLPYLKEFTVQEQEIDTTFKLIKGQFYKGESKLRLSKQEQAILHLFVKSKGKLVTYDEIGESLWRKNTEKFSLWAISQIISRLRKKLTHYDIHPQTIRSVRAEGYIFS